MAEQTESAQKSDDMDISTKHVAQPQPYSGEMIEFSKVQAIRNPDTKLPPDFDISQLKAVRIVYGRKEDKRIVNSCCRLIRAMLPISQLTTIGPEEFKKFDPFFEVYGFHKKEVISLWFMSQDLLLNEELVREFECCNSTRKVPILLQKCDIPERLKKYVFLDISEANDEDASTLVSRAPQLYDYWKLKWVMEQFKAEPDLERIMTDDRDFHDYYEVLRRGKPIRELWLLEKLKVCLKYSHLANDIIDDVEENLCRKQQKLCTWRRGDWDGCVEKRDLIGILDLLQIGRYPNKNQLRMLCEFLGRKHPLTKIVCVKISDFIREQNPQLSSENIIRPVYEEKDENEVIFLIHDESNKKNTKKIDVDKINVTIELRNLKSPNSENEQVVEYELEENIELDYELMDQMEKFVNDNSERLCKDYSNIIMITASPVKSIGYKNDKFANEERKHSIQQRNCIVLFVPAKGLIPLQEDCFPKMLGSFETDVREGYCEMLVGGGPRNRHQNLKMGCAIGMQSDDWYGTLGGFVDHPSYGLCAVTCAHVVLTKEEKENPLNFRSKTIVQPPCGDVFGIVEKEMYKYSSGKDAALIKITQNEREPIDGHFPDCTENERNSAGFRVEEKMLYRSGKILKLDKTNRVKYKIFRLVKFGAATSIRRGQLRSVGITVRYGLHKKKRFENQIQIYPFQKGEIFAERGDSGSFVFIVTYRTEFLLIGMLTSRANGFWNVTPINDVLADLDCNDEAIKIFVPTEDREITYGNI